MNDEHWKLVTEYSLNEYSNGLRQGARVRLSKDLICRDTDGQPTGKDYVVGELWLVLPGVVAEPHVVWLRDPNGDRHTWDLNDFFEWFQLVDNSGT